ncbi:UDP-glycosyltransferase 73D1-like [Typha latifolia]|uniref:UDP-glycosyltransferase 73D1-like n=1 Tax=Typha latifolia TaxID=4733 RepID=UPI003C309C34
MEITNSPNHHNLHFILIPWLAPGHMIPMIDISRVLASHGAAVTLFTTPVNAARIKPTIDRLSADNIPIKFVPLRFPAVEAGLPAGCENMDSIPNRALLSNFLNAAKLLRGPMAQYLRDIAPRPSCIISGTVHSWAPELAREFGVPCFFFQGFCSFSLLCCHNLYTSKVHDAASSPTEPFVIPDLPFEFKIARKQLPAQFQLSQFSYLVEEQRKAELAADGVVVNSFEELEPGCAELLRIASGKLVWSVGPVSLCNTSKSDLEERGDKASVDTNECITWLDSKKPRSVIYVSFGSTTDVFQPKQLTELGLGLLACKWSFIWVVKDGELFSPDFEGWLHENFEARADGKCLLIRGWGPQVMILSHRAVGGFLTHCGWNSTLESVAAGVPMVTWPLFAEQFMNQKLILDILRIGVRVGDVDTAVEWLGLANDSVAVWREDVTKALESLMDGGEEGEERRKRAEELRKKAKTAIEKGGSSYLKMKHLMQFVDNYKAGTNA